MTVLRRFQGRQTQFHIELLYGVLFIAGFGYLVFRVDPRVAAFNGGLVVGYLLRIWEKMSIYERILEEAVSREAETQVKSQVEEQVGDEVASEVDAQVQEEVASELEQQVGEEVDKRLGEEVKEQVEAEIGDLDEHVTERLEDAEELDESRSDQSDSSTA